MKLKVIMKHKSLGVEKELDVQERVATPHDLSKLLERLESYLKQWEISKIYVEEVPGFLN